MNRLVLMPLGLALLAINCTNAPVVAVESGVPKSASVVTEELANQGDPLRGYDLLVNKPFLPPDFDEAIFDEVWQVWPKPLREKARLASPSERRKMAMERYGLTTRGETPEEQLPGDPLQYVVTEHADGTRTWTMNCFSCHGGTVYGDPFPGAPNNRFALQTMTEDLRATKLKLAKPLSRMDLGSLVIPLGSTHGTTNAVIFGVGLMSRRDTDLKLIDEMPVALVHHDMDAPPWWHFSTRPDLYIDGFAKRGHRGLMQFTLVPENGPDFYREHEADFKDIYAYLMSLRPPRYPLPIDESLAERGHRIFNNHCASCHGTYGDDSHYPNVRVPLNDIGTDPVRLTAIPVGGRRKYADSWFAVDADGNRQQTTVDPDGYVAPPLDGVWASAPYFHNGSVPTLWDVLHPDTRPKVWRRVTDELDESKVGLTVESVDRIPLTQSDMAVRRQYFDTQRFGKSNRGHEYPNALTEAEKRAVLEFLKTL
jgi:mono/diheme cytochrome c family protein